jgi:ribosomal protein S18 acetylase RimI-like enzyme
MRKPELAPATLADAPVIADLSRRLIETNLPWSWTPARVARHISHADSMVLAARTGEQLAGFAIMHFGDEVAHLNLLAVDTPWQRRGLGRLVMEWLETSAVTAGIFLVCLEVRARNPGAVSFYRQLGYQEAGRLTRYYAGREDAVRMTRDLRHPASRPGSSRLSGTSDRDGGTRNGPVTADWILQRFRK